MQDDLIIEKNTSIGKQYKKIALPLSQNSKNGDFLFYSAMDSILPNPFTSINDLLPTNRLESLQEFAIYPSYWSTLHHAAAVMVEGRISKDFKDDMQFFDDANGENMFTLAIKRKNINIILEVLKNLCQMSQDKLNAISKSIPL